MTKINFGPLDMGGPVRQGVALRRMCVGACVDSADGNLRRLPTYEKLAKLPVGAKALMVHQLAGGVENLIYVVGTADGGSAIGYLSLPDGAALTVATAATKFHGASAVGSMVVMAGDDGLNYLYWKDGAYRFLGAGLPKLEMSFRLVDEPMGVAGGSVTVALDDAATADALSSRLAQGGGALAIADNGRYAMVAERLGQAVMSLLLDGVRSTVVERNRFWQPFFVRGAVRLSDGTLIHHSPPELMWPCGAHPPIVGASDVEVDTNALELRANLSAGHINRCRLEVSVADYDHERWAQWADIVKGVEVGVTKPMATFMEDCAVGGFVTLRHLLEDGGGGNRPGADGSTPGATPGAESVFAGRYADEGDGEVAKSRFLSDGALDELVCAIKPMSKADFAEALTANAAFYKAAEIALADMRLYADGYKAVKMSAGFLQSIEGTQRFDDDYQSGDSIVFADDACALTAFNGALVVAPRWSMPAVPWLPAAYFGEGDEARPDCQVLRLCGVKIALRRNSELVEVARAFDCGDGGGWGVISDSGSSPFWFFHPDVGAEEVTLYAIGGDGTVVKRSHRLSRHHYWNGAYCYDDSPGPWEAAAVDDVPVTIAPKVAVAPSLWWTGGGVPLGFGWNNRLSLPGGDVVALRVATKAMSPGQFGRFPLYFFGSGGIGVADCDSSGGWSTPRLLTIAAVKSSAAVAQVDGGAVAASASGVLLVEGSAVRRVDSAISPEMCCCSAESSFDCVKLPMVDRVVAEATADDVGALTEALEFDDVAQLALAYDPTLGVLYAARRWGSTRYGAAFSLDGGGWGVARLDSRWRTHAVSSAAGLLWVDAEGGVWKRRRGPAMAHGAPPMLWISAAVEPRPGQSSAIVRYELVGRGVNDGDVVALYGSNDGERWSVVSAMRGRKSGLIGCRSPWRYYRFVVSTTACDAHLLVEAGSR